MNYYITPEEYEEAKKNGIQPYNLELRIRLYGWDKERAITTPVQSYNIRKKWVQIAEENGIGYATFMTRVNTYKWDEERAATQPLQDRKTQMMHIKEKQRKIPDSILYMAKENGINYITLYQRIRKGWDPAEAATTPPMSKADSARIAKRIAEKHYGNLYEHIYRRKAK